MGVDFAYERGTHRFKGYAYFMYSTRELADFAMFRLDNKLVGNRRIGVAKSKTRLSAPNLRRKDPFESSRTGGTIWQVYNPTRRV